MTMTACYKTAHAQGISDIVAVPVVILCLAIGSCSAAPPPKVADAEMDCLKTGIELRDANNHLHASYWFEAALAQHPDKEPEILRLLVESQIRSGRLLAAQSGLARLRQLTADDPSIDTLAMAIHCDTKSSTPDKEILP